MTYEEAWKELKNKIYEEREENIRNAELHAEVRSYEWAKKLINEACGIGRVIHFMNMIEFDIDK